MTVSTCSTNNSEIIGTILNSRTPHIARNKEWVKWSTNPQKFNCISFLMTRSSKKKQFGKSKSDQRPCLDKAEDEKDPIVKPLNHATSFAVQAENKINNFLLSCPPPASAQSVPRMHHLEIFTWQLVLPL